MVRGVVFDFDGVICQTERYRMEFLASQAARLGLTATPGELYPMAGGQRGLRESVLDRVFAGEPSYPAKREELLSARYPGEVPFRDLQTDGLTETLAALQKMGLQMAIASNSSLEYLSRALEECGISGYFSSVQSGMNAERRKPDPYVYKQALLHLGLGPAECLAVEDSPLGIEAGKAAGLKVAALRDPFEVLDQSAADMLLHSLRELPALIAQL